GVEPSEEMSSLAVRGPDGLPEVSGSQVMIVPFGVEPAIPLLLLAPKKIEFVIAKHALCAPGHHHVGDALHDGRAVLSAIHEITQEHEPPASRMLAVTRVAKASDQGVERRDLAVYVGNDINRSIEQGLDMLLHEVLLTVIRFGRQSLHRQERRSDVPNSLWHQPPQGGLTWHPSSRHQPRPAHRKCAAGLVGPTRVS